jgi:RNA polymerase sigma-70 factor (ECF subfamily)
MAEELRTETLHELIDKHRAGDRQALSSLIGRTARRLERLAHRMLGDFPGVKAREQPDDVLQSALIRLTRALGAATPANVRDYYRLAAEQLRRELLDLARKHRRRPTSPVVDSDLPDPAANRTADLDLWAALQDAVERLPTALREVFSLVFYHGWTQARIAELLHISDRQVRRLWTEACKALHDTLGGSIVPRG